MEIFEIVALISGWCLGLRAITDDGKIGYPIRALFLKLPDLIAKPILTCCTCMASFWGTIIFFARMEYHGQTGDIWTVAWWLGAVVTSAFVNELLWTIRSYLDKGL